MTAFEECIASIKCVESANDKNDKNNKNGENQTGGADDKIIKYKITYYEELLKTTLNNINLSTIM